MRKTTVRSQGRKGRVPDIAQRKGRRSKNDEATDPAGFAALGLGLTPMIAQAGGDIVITYKDDVSTLDPAIGYDWQNWSMIKSLFDGLMDYKPGTTELMPDLAESYEISPDGKTFTFKLRDGVNFANGREVTADDVKYSIERVVDPATQSPGAGFFGSIDGYDEMSSGAADSLSGITASIR